MCASHWHLCFLYFFPAIKGEPHQLRLFNFWKVWVLEYIICVAPVSYSRTALKLVTWSAGCGLGFYFIFFLLEYRKNSYKVEKISVDWIIFFSVCFKIQYYGAIKFSGCFECLIWKWENLIGFEMKATDTGRGWKNNYYRNFLKYFNIVDEIFLWVVSRTRVLLGFQPFISSVSILSSFEIYRESAKVATLLHNLLFENRQLGEQII